MPNQLMKPTADLLRCADLIYETVLKVCHARPRSRRLILCLAKCMNSVSRRRSRISLVAMIVGGLLTVAPVFGPLGKTLHYLADFIAERPQPMRVPDFSFFAEPLGSYRLSFRPAHVCHIAGSIYSKWRANRAAR